MNFHDEEEYTVRRRRRNEPDFWHRLNKVITTLVVLGFLTCIAIVFYPAWLKREEMRARVIALRGEQVEKTAQLKASSRQIELLRHDPEYVETIARDRINVMKPGETIFRVEIPRTLGTSVQP
ncbi:MAG: septum formation initiator family protein [Chthoniobacterales bacterium]|jgi:cell division protein FtsB